MSWAEIKHSINSNLGLPLDLLIKERSVIKSIQRGRTAGGSSSIISIIISEVVPSKCLIILDNDLFSHAGTHLTVYGANTVSLNTNTLVIRPNMLVSQDVTTRETTYQIIEFN